HVEVRVDQAGHERAAAEVDAGRGGRLDRPIGNFLDALAFDQNLDPVHEFAAARIEEASAEKQEGGHGGGLCGWRRSCEPMCLNNFRKAVEVRSPGAAQRAAV